MCSDHGAALIFMERLRLCLPIADALTVLYTYAKLCREMKFGNLLTGEVSGIIHHDVEPKNILMYEENNTLVAKVADFGFSTRTSNDDMINLPCSVPWNAPEYHPRKFTSRQPRKSICFPLACFVYGRYSKKDFRQCPKIHLIRVERRKRLHHQQ